MKKQRQIGFFAKLISIIGGIIGLAIYFVGSDIIDAYNDSHDTYVSPDDP